MNNKKIYGFLGKAGSLFQTKISEKLNRRQNFLYSGFSRLSGLLFSASDKLVSMRAISNV
jgi:hypothetical protein